MLTKTIHHFLTLLILLITTTYQQTISQADFILGATYTKSTLWDNFIGVSLYYDNIQNLMNSTLYQSYHLNSNIKGDWRNNFAISLKTPLGHKYNCTALSANITNPNVTCNFQTQGNQTYWKILGDFVWNTVNQPNWCMGYDMQGVNLTLPSHQQTFFDWIYQVYRSTYYVIYCT